MLCRFSFSQYAVPAAGARILRLSHRAVHGAAGDHDDRMRPMVGAAGRELRNTAVSTGRGRRFYAEHAHADTIGPTYLGRMAGGCLRTLRRRFGDGQSGDQQQRSGRNAAVASGGSGGHRFDQPAGRCCDRCCGVWNSGGSKPCAWYRFHHGDSRDLVGDDGMRRSRVSVGVCIRHSLGASKHGTGGAPARRTPLTGYHPIHLHPEMPMHASRNRITVLVTWKTASRGGTGAKTSWCLPPA